ncbi:hypothetical protein HY621_01570 [Candidatus Uhrbacteria bacterium]|nr:hypothetical protein [Candidatus Uhrbacteria bacterium]
MPGPNTILRTPSPGAMPPPSRSTLAANSVSSRSSAASSVNKTGPIDFRGVSRQGALKGIRSTHHFKRGLYRQLKSILPGSANYALREELTDIINNSISPTGKIYREGLRRFLRDKSIGVGRIMTPGQRDRFFRATGLDKREGNRRAV